MVETVVDWRPFEYFTVEQSMLTMPVFERITFRLTPTTEGGTHLEVREWGRTTGVAALDRPIYRFLLTKVYPTRKMLEILARLIEEDRASQAEKEGAPQPAAA